MIARNDSAEYSPTTRPMNILFVAPMPMIPASNGGASRIWALVNYLRHRGHKIGMVTLHHREDDEAELRARLDSVWMTSSRRSKFSGRTIGRHLDTLRRYIYPHEQEVIGPVSSGLFEQRRIPAIDDLAVSVCDTSTPDAVICVFAWTAALLDRIDPTILKIIDTIDVQHLRDASATEAGYPPLGVKCTADEEKTELMRADILIAIQRHDRETIQRLLPEKKVVLAEHAMSVDPSQSPADSQEVLFIGNLYQPNVEGILAFIYSVWPKIRRKCKGAQLTVCGRVSSKVESCPEKGIKVLGLVPDLGQLMRRAAVIINPTPFGTGLKIKAVEAMAYGKCLVSTAEGVLGLHPDITDTAIVTPLEAMAPHIITLLNSTEERRALEQKAENFARMHLHAGSVYSELENALALGTRSFNEHRNSYRVSCEPHTEVSQ